MDNHIYKSHPNRKSVDVDVVKLDDYFKNTDVEFDFINSNIQGADFAGIQGMQSLLQKSPNTKFIVEFSPDQVKQFGSDPNEFIDTMAEQNFNFYEVWWYNKKIKPITIKKLKDYTKKT